MKQKNMFWFGLLFMLPAIVIFATFTYYPFLSSLFYSFTRWDGINKPVYIGLQNYWDFFHDTAALHGSLHTLYILIFGLVISNPLSLFLALLLNKSFKSKSFLRTMFYLPVIVSLTVVSVIWSGILKYDGVLNAILPYMGMGSLVKDWLGTLSTALPTVILISVWQGTGFGAVIYLAGLQSIPKELMEASTIDGAAGWRKLIHITIPLLMPVITICTFLGLVGSLRFFDLPYILTNGGPGDATLTLAMTIYNFAFVNQTYGYATAAGIVFMIFIVIITTLQLKFTRDREVEM